MSKLMTIINAKISDKSKLGEWYTDRLKVCMGCEFNSENKSSLSIKEKGIVLANLGNPSCLACGCEITAKASVETENCGMVKLNKPSKWVKLDISHDTKFIVVNKTESKAKLILNDDGTYLADYGILMYDSDSTLEFKVSKKGLEIKKLSVSSSCGCTVPEYSFDAKSEITFRIAYDSKRKGSFSKSASLIIEEKKGKTTRLFFNITGQVQ